MSDEHVTLRNLILDELIVMEPDEGWTRDVVADDIMGMIRATTEDGPVRSADGTLVVHRADPELAAFLNEWADELNGYEREVADQRKLRRAAALVAGE